ncbi:MAG: type II toxin-antitoxin system RelE/ParE family toxin [Clostridiales bacterium]|jgi:plasmid stabilization system protein ParE|nr:type II toxin-antitoxin system RelE/ParE family toxin [Clostridiales bacterium]
MQEKSYKLRYIPKYEKDLNVIVDYIVYKLHNPNSAIKLMDKIESAILGRLKYPLSFEPFQSVRKRMTPYYRIYVDNFTVYYVVIDDVMEVRRILYKGRDAESIIK